MSHEIVVLPEAAEDVERTYRWLAERSINGAIRWYKEWLNAQKALQQNPFLFGMAPENEQVSGDIRQMFFRTRRGRPYRVLFSIEGSDVRVMHVRGPGQPPVSPSELE